MNPRTLRNAIRQNLVKLGIATIVAASSASASVVGIYGGIDTGVGPGGPFPNSTAAEAAFWAALSVSGPTVTFEGVSGLSNLGAGVSATILTGDPLSGLKTADQHDFCPPGCTTPDHLGFNTTSGGNEWLQVVPPFNSAGTSVVFSFSSAINAFGLWLTDTQSGLPGPITITFNDGTAESLSVTKNGVVFDPLGIPTYPGGAVYYGFITDAPFSSLTISTGATGGTRDEWGIDDITLSEGGTVINDSPEPSTWSLLLGAALVTISLKFRSRSLRYATRTSNSSASSRNR